MQWQILAGVRFFLAWVVMCSHLARFVAHGDFLLNFDRFGSLTAVIGFLMISGYSIAHSIIRLPKGFYKRRLCRIYPLYSCSIFFSLLPYAIAKSTTVYVYFLPDWKLVIGNLLFLQGFWVKYLSSNPIVWTLSIEVFCYLLAPLFIKFQTKALFLLFTFSSLLYLSYCLAYSKFHLPYFTELQYGLPFFLLLWAWLLGFLLSTSNNKIIRILLITSGLLLVKYSLNNGSWYVLNYAICVISIVYLPSIKIPKKMLKLLTYLGDVSYPVYLFHLPCFILLYGVFHINTSVALIAFSLGVAIVFYHAIDIYSQRQHIKRII